MLRTCLQPAYLQILRLLFVLIFLDIASLLDHAHAYGAQSLVGRLHLELDLLVRVQRVKGRFDEPGSMKEYLAAVSIGNEPESPVAHQLFYFTFVHCGHPFCAFPRSRCG